MSSNAVICESLCKTYGTREALRAVSLEIAAGTIFGLLGPNGGGKTTLCRILATLIRPTSGTARVDGESVIDAPASVRRRLGLVFQNPALDKKLTVRENLRYQGAFYGLAGKALASRIDAVLAATDLTARADERVERLSGGLARRADLARGLLHGPRVLILDEPSTGLDPAARRELREHLRRLRDADGTTILLTTHLLDEADGCDRLALLDQGQKVAEGTPGELKAEVGADVITVTTPNANGLQTGIRERFGIEATLFQDRLRMERAEGHAFIPKLIEAFHGDVLEVTLARPTLEDVFIRKTGRALAAR